MEQIGKIIQQLRQEPQTQPDSSRVLQLRTTLVSEYGSRESFLAVYNPDYQRKICGQVTECYFGDYPTLSTLKAGYGANAPAMWLIPQLFNLSEYCGCRDKLQESQLKDCANVIAMDFHFLKVSELMLFFHRFKSGVYGRFYGSIDPLIITTSLRTFLGERAAVYDRREQEEREKARAEARKGAVTREQYLAMREGKSGRAV